MGFVSVIINIGGVYLMYVGARTLWNRRKARLDKERALRLRIDYLEEELQKRPIDGGTLISDNTD